MMFGALSKTYYAEFAGIDPKDIVSISIMPCTAKKFECQRPEMCSSGYRDVDYVLTTRELARMIKEAGIDFVNLPDEEYDAPMGEYTGAATIFGATGGVMEAAIRTVYAVVTGNNLPDLNVTPVRGLEGVKDATLTVGALGPVSVAVAHGLEMPARLWIRSAMGNPPMHSLRLCAVPVGASRAADPPFRQQTRSGRFAPALYMRTTVPFRSIVSPMKVPPSRRYMKPS
jgi:iron only hydrogenase large subunit-like protein